MTSHVSLGTMTLGGQCDLQASEAILAAFIEKGGNDIDTATMYPALTNEGATEKVLGQLFRKHPEWRGKLAIATKANPWRPDGFKSGKVREQLENSLVNMSVESVDLFYLHSPDHAIPIEDTLAEVKQLFDEGKFKAFGLSNYAAWQVADIYHRCKEGSFGFVPTVYQGMYNALTRDVERELFPCLRALDIKFYAYNITCGGLITGKHRTIGQLPTEGRFANNAQYQGRYWKDSFFAALSECFKVCDAAGIAPADAAHRWLVHHSKMDVSLGDKLIIGVSKLQYLEANFESAANGAALPEEIVAAFDAGWQITKPTTPSYFR